MKKRIITVLIAIFTVIPFVLITPKANTTQTSTHTVTSYGDYTFQQGTSDSTFNYELPGLPINLTYTSGSWMKLDYNFKDKYSGTMKFTVTSSADWVLNSSNVYWGVSAEGAEATCYISATTTMNSVSKTKTFSVIFQHATAIHFSVAAPNNLNFFNSSQSITISNASFTSQPDMHEIYSEIDHISSQFDFYIPGMTESLSNIDTDLDNINQNLQALSPYIDQLEGYVDGLETYLQTISNISTYDVPIYSYPAWLFGSSFGTINNTYTYIDTMNLLNVAVNTRVYQYNNDYAFLLRPNQTIYWLYYTTYWNYNGFQLVDANNTMYYWTTTPISDINGFKLYLAAFTNTNTTDTYYSITNLNMPLDRRIIPLYLGMHIPDDVAYLYGLEYNNTYTRLLESINNGIGTLNDDYDTSTYENYEQTLDGLNDGLRGRFDNVDNNMQNNVDTLFTPSGTAGSDGSVFEKFHFNAVNNFMSSFINRIFVSFPAFKYILIFALLLLVIGVMI